MHKIHGEHTRPTDQPLLCLTCIGAMIVRGTRFGDDVIKCGHGLGRVTFHVTDCNRYDDARLIQVYRLEETAWRWMSTRFVSPSEFQRLQHVPVPSTAMQQQNVASLSTLDAVDPHVDHSGTHA